MLVNLINNFFLSQNSINLLESLYFRIFIAFLFSFFFTIITIKYLIIFLNKHSAFQPIRIEGPEGHLITKQKTPTMGGLPSCLAILFSGILFCNLNNIYIVAILIISMFFGLIGLIDDIMKVFYKNPNGFKGSIKFILEVLICGLTLLWIIDKGSSFANQQEILIPFFKFSLYIGFLFIPFVLLVIIGSTNGVNFTDGLDGLAIIPIMLCAFTMGIIAITTSYNLKIITTINPDNMSELAILCSSLIGTGIAFFIYNKHPAKIFMGDVGALMYGAFLGSLAVMLKYEIFYAIIGLLFVIESISVILQVGSYKLFKKRIFKMAPIHHHFEKIGWSEKKIIINFWMFSLICLIIGLLGIINF